MAGQRISQAEGIGIISGVLLAFALLIAALIGFAGLNPPRPAPPAAAAPAEPVPATPQG